MSVKPAQSVVQTVRDYGKRLFGFIRGRVKTDEDAEDIMQDVWYQLSNVIDTTEIEQMSAWLYKVARNKITDKYRKKTTESLDDLDQEDDDDSGFNISHILFADGSTLETENLKELFWAELFAALDELPENQRQVFIWNELEDRTFQQISGETGENIKTLISRKGYAVKHLRKRLEALYNEYCKF